MVNDDQFHTTHWSVVLTAKGDDTAAKAALRTLCEMYYQPVFRMIERGVASDASHVYGGREAGDLTHDFFATLLEGEMFSNLRRERGRFRAYLLGAVKHFLAKIREKESTAKRGGLVTTVTLVTDHPGAEVSPEILFDRDWAQITIDRAVASLDSPETQALLPWLTRQVDAEIRQQLAAQLDTTEVAVKVALHRLRKKFRHNIRTLIAETVEDATEIDAELDHLIRILAHFTEGESSDELRADP